LKYYAVAEIDITDASWVPSYLEHTTPLVERYGGRYLARTPSFEKIEGERNPPQIYLLIEWPSKEASEAFFESAEYRPYRESRQQGSRGQFVLVAGEDVGGVARI
jgi:uncharacterized protein (DUF1330 family)